ncbi:unnamed protein product [Prorocentrum cordatum]|uniref:Uncharacterized protein n=2 Tax=Prorocentrum cordatum TaxID=2364126 RepID=A0ABN9WCV0_9DINO|nr:unnamed protein product [Polarella glacialis]
MPAGALALAISVFAAAPSAAFGILSGLPQATDPLSRLENRLRPIYVTLPRDGDGLPDSSGVRYLARRYLEAEHGWVLKGLDTAPWLRDGHNASLAAARRAAEVLGTGGALQPAAAWAPLLSALSPQRGRGFTLREAAEAVHALEALVASHDAVLMRRARALSKARVHEHEQPTPMHKALVMYVVLLHTRSRDLISPGPDQDPRAEVAVRRALDELADLRVDFSNHMSGVPLAQALDEATRDANVGSSQSAARIYSGMRHLRRRLAERYTSGCRRLRGVLSSMDHEGTGQVEFRHAYATKLQNWQFLETPEYLAAVGALTKKGAKGVGPGVLIPNYVSGVNSCDDRGGAHPTMWCCPDECEAEILPRLEAAAAGPRISPKQVWAALSRLIKADKTVAADERKELHSQLRALGLRSRDGSVEVHGRQLGSWLHRAFPQTCPRPPARGSPAVVDPALSPLAWVLAGKHLPVDDVSEVEQVRAHLQTRWGSEGADSDPRTFAARSPMSLDQEVRLIGRLHQQHKSGGPPVHQALEDAINVRVLDRPARAEGLLAAFLAAALLGPLVAATLAMRSSAADACSSQAAAATKLLRSAEPAAPGDREGGEHGVGAAPGEPLGPRSPCEADPAGSEKSTDAGDTDSEAAVELSAEDSDSERAAALAPAGAGDTDSEAALELSAEGSDADSEREAAKASAEARRGRAGASDEHPSQGEEAALDAATGAKSGEELGAREAQAAAQVWPLAGPACGGWLPSSAAVPRGFRPPPGLDPPPGLQLKLQALGLEPDWHRAGE